MDDPRHDAPLEWPHGALLSGATVLAPEVVDAEAVGLLGDRVVVVGSASEAAAALPEGHAVLDLAGHTLVPGFVDAHVHPLPAAFFEHHLDLGPAGSIEEVLDLLADRARTTDPDGPVVGLQLDDAALTDARLPTRVELDGVADGRPVVLLRRDGHHAVGSTAALEAAGLTPDGADPPGGSLERDADGSLTGLCREAAASQLMGLVPVPEWDELAAALHRWAARLVCQGVTGISAICQTSDEGPAGSAGELEAVAWSAMAPALPFDVQTVLIAADPSALDDHRGGPLDDPAAGRRLDGLKIFLDGTLGGRSACLHAPYADRPEETGMLGHPEAVVRDRIRSGHLAGASVCVHAIGDRATRLAVDLFAEVLAEHPGPHRHRIEHASVLDESTVAAMAELGVAGVVQPISLVSERRWLRARLGDERLARTYPFRSMLDAGVTVAGSSDAPIEDVDVVAAMAAAVHRDLAPAEALTPVEALGLYTTGAARVRGVDADRGRLAAGHRADVAVLRGDLSASPGDVSVAATVIAGAAHHGAGYLAGRRRAAEHS